MARIPNQRQGNERPQPSEAESVVNDSLGLDLQDLDNEGDDDGGEDDGEVEPPLRTRKGEETPEGDEHDDDSQDGDQLDGQPQDALRDLTERVSHTAPKETPLPRLKQDKKGNLLDASGKIVARAGAEARFYHAAHKARGEVAQIRESATNQIRDYSTRLHKAIEIGTQVATELERVRGEQKFVADLGLKSDEVREAASLFAEGKKDPVSVIRKLLTRAAARGIDIAQLGVQGTGVDAKSLVEMVREEMAKGLNPLKERTTAEARQAELDKQTKDNKDRVTAEVTSFFKTIPKAVPFMPVFESVMANPANAGLSLAHIWDRIQLNLLQSGKTVDGIIAQIQGKQQRGTPENRRSIPRGRDRPSFDGNEGENEMAPIATSFDDILKGVLKDHSFGRTEV